VFYADRRYIESYLSPNVITLENRLLCVAMLGTVVFRSLKLLGHVHRKNVLLIPKFPKILAPTPPGTTDRRRYEGLYVCSDRNLQRQAPECFFNGVPVNLFCARL